jgi:hypothetical protein
MRSLILALGYAILMIGSAALGGLMGTASATHQYPGSASIFVIAVFCVPLGLLLFLLGLPSKSGRHYRGWKYTI